MDEAPPKNSLGMGILALCLGFIGLFMVAHGMGVVDASWLRPNPKTPSWVFSLIGVVLMLSGLLALAQALPIPKWLFNGAGWLVIGLAMVMAHWLVFFSDGARCLMGDGTVFMRFSGVLCYGLASLVLGVFDLIFALIVGGFIWRKLR